MAYTILCGGEQIEDIGAIYPTQFDEAGSFIPAAHKAVYTSKRKAIADARQLSKLHSAGNDLRKIEESRERRSTFVQVKSEAGAVIAAFFDGRRIS
jgi:hypothetical protein